MEKFAGKEFTNIYEVVLWFYGIRPTDELDTQYFQIWQHASKQANRKQYYFSKYQISVRNYLVFLLEHMHIE
jgi:hypothetical protein